MCPAGYIPKIDIAAFVTCSQATDIVDECCAMEAHAALQPQTPTYARNIHDKIAAWHSGSRRIE